MRKLNLIFYNLKNYGDALNPLLFRELSGLIVQNKDYLPTAYKKVRRIFSYLTSFDKKFIQTSILPGQNSVLGVGSIIRMSNNRTSIWGAGFMNQSEKCKGGKVYAVRGKLTADKLHEQGFPLCEVYGDPALLLPLFISPQKKHKKIALIPHFKETAYFINRYGDRYDIIDFRTKDVKSVTEKISSYEYILSTSLHGIIVAHAYDIPALWIKKGYIDTDGFKFHDYFSSVDIPLYDGFTHIDDILESENAWKMFFKNHEDKSRINNSLQSIQLNLLKTAPFPLTLKYKKLLDNNEL